MGGARGRAYAIGGGILYAVVSSRMNQIHELKSAQVVQVRPSDSAEWWRGHGGDEEIEVETVVTWFGGSEVVLAGAGWRGGEMMVWRGVGCGDEGGAVKAAMVMAAAKAVVVR
ncbi:hypothetical protein Tco_0682866 [Tanacetum coccineum]|uniref:Uncharacterized protein n=1 Tax=Tanacetum coccineum TaxID=301880 RepID=A0ABQ4XTC0_9ASTR